MKALITGGGTGGHIYPALSVADKLKENNWEIEYIGNPDSLEKEILKNTEYSFKEVNVLPLPRGINYKLIKSLLISLKAVFQSYKIIKKINPDVVFGTGGYVTGPVILGAYLNGIPTIIHEQNIYPGITNKLLSYFVNKIAVNNIEAAKYFKKSIKNKIVETGNPIRKEIIDTTRDEGLNKLGLKKDYKTLFIMGGSQGSSTINEAVIESIEQVLKIDKLQVILITGKDNYENVLEKIEHKLDRYSDVLKIMPYLNNIEWAYAAADLIIYRAGATGIAEITGRGLPAILIPFPYSAEGHQEVNAKFMEDNRAAVMVDDGRFNGQILYNLVKELFEDKKRLKQMGKNSKKLAKLKASKNIVEIIENQVREE
ncbi:MAG TPA: undecaprenyldiphospho-muramoylpentapeptide beta-N-acetylglucosaminyltransferase [Halanaerobiales bacterium]|nr:undecaprenyldiphospho-muramoylpentapeptide beta-N-acetylglucosaminyltransferase [Halanaerobiales bacterium]